MMMFHDEHQYAFHLTHKKKEIKPRNKRHTKFVLLLNPNQSSRHARVKYSLSHSSYVRKETSLLLTSHRYNKKGAEERQPVCVSSVASFFPVNSHTDAEVSTSSSEELNPPELQGALMRL